MLTLTVIWSSLYKNVVHRVTDFDLSGQSVHLGMTELIKEVGRVL